MAVVIGVDPHKGSHTAVAVDQAEKVLGELRVRSSPGQVDRLLFVGGAVARAYLGRRRRRRARLPAGPATGVGGRNCP